jgi:hypothetical protein
VAEGVSVAGGVPEGEGVGVGADVVLKETSSMRKDAGAEPSGAWSTRTRADAASAGGCTAPVVRKTKSAVGPAARSSESVVDSAGPLASFVGYHEMRRCASRTPSPAWRYAENS